MNLIQILIKHKQQSIITHFNKQTFQDFQLPIANTPKITDTSVEFFLIKKHFKIYDIFVKVNINWFHKTISIKSIFFRKKLIRAENHYQKSIIIKNMLKNQISGIQMLFCHPRSGELIVQSTFLFNQHQFSKLIPIIINCIDVTSFFRFEKINKLLTFIDKIDLSENQQNKQEYLLNQIKKYIMNSNEYTWFLLRSATKRNKFNSQFFVYNDTKLKYEHKDRYFCQNQKIKAFSEILCQKPKKLEIYLISKSQDQQIKKKYLEKISAISKYKKQLNQITVPIQFLKSIYNQIDIKINCYQVRGGINVRIRKAKQPFYRKYQKALLIKFPQNQFLNLVKHFIIKNNPQFNQKWQITNLYQSQEIQTYIQNNKQTISIFTLMTIINQIAIALKYLRDLNIAYHNLIPKNIYIKRGLLVKLDDLSNAYHYTIYNIFMDSNQIILNKFPFIQNILNGKNRTIDDQRSDVYSFGNFIYWILLGKDKINLKQSSIKNLNVQQKIAKLQKNNPSSLEILGQYNHKPIKLLMFFIMRCIHYERIQIMGSLNQMFENSSSNSQETQTSYIQLQSRPYLDWIVIVIKSIYNLYQKNFS